MAKKQIIYRDGQDTGEATGPDENILPWMFRQGVIGLADTPGAFTALYGLLGAGNEYLSKRFGVSGDPLNPGRPDPNASFKESLYTPEGLKQLEQYNTKVMDDLRSTYPDLDDTALNQKFERIQKHGKKYYSDTSQFMRPGISFARRWGKGVNEFFGDDRLPTERTQADTLMNVVGGSLPAPGASTIVRATGSAGARVASSTAGKVALNAIEVATPATIPATKGRFAANVGVGTGIDQAARIAESQPSVIADAASGVKAAFTKDDGSTDVANVAGAGAVATILGGLALKNLHKVRGAVQGGPPRGTMTNQAYPEPGLRTAQALGDTDPLIKSAKNAGLADEDLTILATKIEQQAGPMARADHDNWWSDRVDPIVARFQREDPDFQQTLQQHIADRVRIYSDEAAIKEVEDRIIRVTNAYNRAVSATTPNPTRVASLTRELTDLHTERQVRQADGDPNLRFSSMSEARADVQARLNNSARDPRIRAVEQQLNRMYDEVVDVTVANGLISQTAANKWKASIRRGNFNLSENPLAQKTWLETVKDRVNSKVDAHLVFANTEEAIALYRGIRNSNVRKGYKDTHDNTRYVNPRRDWVPEPRTNNPTDPFSELAMLSLRTRQAASANRMMKDYFDAMRTSPGNAQSRLVREHRRIPEKQVHFRQKEIIDLLNKDSRPYYTAYFDRGDLVIMSHNSRVVRDTFKFAPSAVVPILNQSRKIFQANTTGSFNPAFAFVSMPWDVALAALFRSPDMVFGPLSRLSAEAFGRGSLLSRYISAASTPVDLLYNLVRLPDVAVKRILLETMGHQLGQRWQAQLATNTGVIGQIAKLPGGQQVLGSVVGAMVKAYEHSWTAAMKAMKVGHTSNYSDEILDQMRKLDNLGKAYPMYKSAWSGYKAILSVLHDTPKELFLSQNMKLYKRELAKGRTLARHLDEQYIANEARKIGGDFARRSGNRYVQGTLSTIPFGNTILQSLRYTGQRIKSNGAEGVARLASMGMAVAGLYHYVASNPELSDWFFNQLPPEQRTQTLPLPNPVRFARRMWGENIPMGTPKEEIIPIRMPPEMMPFVVPLMHGLMALGFIQNPNVAVPPTVAQDFKAIMDQTFGLTLPPLLQAGAAVFGQKIDPGKGLQGATPFREIREFSFSGANRNKMSPESRIPHSFHDAFSALFGTVSSSVLQAANYGDIIAGKTGSKWEGVKEGVKKLGVDRAASTPYAAHIWPDVNRRYIYTPYLQKLQEDMGVLRKVDQQFSNEPELRALSGRSRTNTVDYLSGQDAASVGMPVSDPDVKALLYDVHTSFFSGHYAELSKERAKARRLHESLTVGVNRTDKESPLMRFKRAQEQAKEVNRLDLELYNQYQDVWKEIQNSPSGKAFSVKYGPLTPTSLLEATRQSAQQASRQPY